jgi:hypothetical protein
MFLVQYRDERGWLDYETYATRNEAIKVSRSLQRQGNVTRIVKKG